MLRGDAAAVFVFGRKLRISAAHASNLDSHLAPRRLHRSRDDAPERGAARDGCEHPACCSRETAVSRSFASSCGFASTVSSVPGRLFFIWTAVVNTSSAPSASNRSADVADDLRTQVVEVRLQYDDFLFSIATRTRAARHGIRFDGFAHRQPQHVGVPGKIARTCAVANLLRRHRGRGPKLVAKTRTIAAPVGVTSSFCTSPEYIGMPFSSSSVAGAGTGITPCAHFTVPPPTFSGEDTNRSTRSASAPTAAQTMSTMASAAPTS